LGAACVGDGPAAAVADDGGGIVSLGLAAAGLGLVSGLAAAAGDALGAAVLLLLVEMGFAVAPAAVATVVLLPVVLAGLGLLLIFTEPADVAGVPEKPLRRAG
jgi:hypothetical protein